MTENLPASNYTYQWRKDGEEIQGATNKQFLASEDGEYTVSVDDGDASGVSGAFEVTVIASPVSPVEVVTSCGPGDVKLQATNDDVEVNWYTSENAISAEYSGHEFITNITSTTDYFIEAKTKILKGHVGLENNSVATGGNHNGGFYLVFDVQSPMKLKKATVYAEGEK